MDTIKTSRTVLFIKKWLDKSAAHVNHHAVLKDIYLEVDISTGYFFTLIVANLIALSGLIINSSAVIIGAMLISPLMGPILGFGSAFITGDRTIWLKSVSKICISVATTVIIAAAATFISPLKEITNEIILRTRPNLYDLIIALLAGAAGAVAICTKKNYLTIVPGVAIATAVIPPLSVTGFGLGVLNLQIALGGFSLFFTNFVAILISTCLVFYIYGFRPSHIKETDILLLKKRISVLVLVLFSISIPLIYTVYQSLSEVRLRNNIQNVLQQAFNKVESSHLDTFSYTRDKEGKLRIDVIVKTVSYMKESDIKGIEKDVTGNLNQALELTVEQILVQPGGLKEQVAIKPAIVPPAVAPRKLPAEIIRSSHESIISVIRESATKVDKVISPSKIANFSVAFDDKTSHVSIILKIQRDSPLTTEEIAWLKGLFATDLNAPVDISVETIPFVPLLVFKKGETSLSEEMIKTMSVIKDVYLNSPDIKIRIISYTGSSFGADGRQRLAEKRANEVLRVLEEYYKIPHSNMMITTQRSRKIEAPAVKIAVERIK